MTDLAPQEYRQSSVFDPDLARLASREPSRAADMLGRVLDPIVMVVLTLVATCSQASASPWSALEWFGLAVVFVAAVPSVVLYVLIRRGHVGEWQAPRRRERYVPYAATMVSLAAGVVVLHALGAPTLLMRVVIAMLVGIIAMAVFNFVTKASMHSGVLAGAAVTVGFLFGPVAVGVGLVLWCLAAWARVRAGRHSLGQVWLGGVTGAVASSLALWLTR